MRLHLRELATAVKTAYRREATMQARLREIAQRDHDRAQRREADTTLADALRDVAAVTGWAHPVYADECDAVVTNGSSIAIFNVEARARVVDKVEFAKWVAYPSIPAGETSSQRIHAGDAQVDAPFGPIAFDDGVRRYSVIDGVATLVGYLDEIEHDRGDQAPTT